MTADSGELNNPKAEQPDPQMVKGIGATAMPETDGGADVAASNEIVAEAPKSDSEIVENILFELMEADDGTLSQESSDFMADRLNAMDRLMPIAGRKSRFGLQPIEWQYLSLLCGHAPSKRTVGLSLPKIEDMLANRLRTLNLASDAVLFSAFEKFATDPIVPESAPGARRIVETAPEAAQEAVTRDVKPDAAPAVAAEISVDPPVEPELAPIQDKQPSLSLTEEEIVSGIKLDIYELGERSGLTSARVEDIIHVLIKAPKLGGTERPISILNSSVGKNTDHYYGRGLRIIWEALLSAAEAARDSSGTK